MRGLSTWSRLTAIGAERDWGLDERRWGVEVTHTHTQTQITVCGRQRERAGAGGGQGVYMGVEGDFAWGDGNTMQWADYVLLSCTLATHTVLLNNVTLINLFKNLKTKKTQINNYLIVARKSWYVIMTIQIQNWTRGDNFGISIVSQYIQVRGIYIPLNFALVLNTNYITLK